jgi:hypothetical protein
MPSRYRLSNKLRDRSSLRFKTEASAQVPKDLQGSRAHMINFLNHMLGFGSGGQQQQGKFGNLAGAAKANAQGGGGTQQFGNAGANLEEFFGALSPLTGGAGGSQNPLDQFVNTPSAEQRALDTSMPALQEMISGQPGAQFERDISKANQQGGRFGSANAILRGEAHLNLLNSRQGAMQTLGMLSQGAGAGQQRQFNMADVGNQRRQAILGQLLGALMGPTLGAPVKEGRSAFENVLAGGAMATDLAALFATGGASGAIPKPQRGNKTQGQ